MKLQMTERVRTFLDKCGERLSRAKAKELADAVAGVFSTNEWLVIRQHSSGYTMQVLAAQKATECATTFMDWVAIALYINGAYRIRAYDELERMRPTPEEFRLFQEEVALRKSRNGKKTRLENIALHIARIDAREDNSALAA